MKNRIISESILSLRQEGLRFSVDSLAEKLNISKKTIYKHFPNKESLAIAIYQQYFLDLKNQAIKLTIENNYKSHEKLLNLYFDAKFMTSNEIFNKYKLNEALKEYVQNQNEELFKIIVSTLNNKREEKDLETIHIIIDGSFEKICKDKMKPNNIVDLLVEMLWL